MAYSGRFAARNSSVVSNLCVNLPCPHIPLSIDMNYFLRLSKKINLATITVLLFIFYFAAIGLAKILFLLFKKEGKPQSAYWKKAKQPVDFLSPF